MENNLDIHIGPRAVKFFIDKHVSKELEKLGITSAYGPFILVIDDNPGTSLKDISVLMSVDKALTTRMVKHLIEEEFAVNTCEEPRKYKMELTDKGKTAAIVIRKQLDSVWKLLLEDFTPEEKNNFFNYSIKIRKTIERYNEEESK